MLPALLSSRSRLRVAFTRAAFTSFAPAAITKPEGGELQVPNNPILPFIEGDGTGPDIWRASQAVFDAAVAKAYGGKRKVAWLEVLAGEKAFKQTGTWLPQETLDAFRKYLVGIKGPLTTPIGKGFRSLNVELRQQLDLYTCLRPVKYFAGVPSPVKRPQDVDMVIFRENCEDIYAGIEFEGQVARDFNEILNSMGVKKGAVRFPKTCNFGIKPVSQEGSERLIRAAIQYALKEKRKSVTLVHKGNIMKFTEGAFRDWGYSLACREFRDKIVTERESWILGNYDSGMTDLTDIANAIDPGYPLMTSPQQSALIQEIKLILSNILNSHGKGVYKKKLMIKDSIADITLQQTLTRASDFDVIATLNLNGDYLSDALAAQVGGIGIAPGGNLNYMTGHAVFEATHGTAPKYANLDKVNPGSVILSGEMMFRFMGWPEVSELILKGLTRAIANKRVTYDFHRLMDPPATVLKCSEFGQEIIKNM